MPSRIIARFFVCGVNLVLGTFFQAGLLAQGPTIVERRPAAVRRWDTLATRVVRMDLRVHPGERVRIVGPASSAPLLESLMVAVAEAGGIVEGQLQSNAVAQVTLSEPSDSVYLARHLPTAADRLDAARFDATIILYGRDADYRGFLATLPQSRRAILADTLPRRWADIHSRSRYISLALPGYGDALAAGRPFDSLLAESLRPIGAEAGAIDREGRRLADALTHARRIVITSPDGTRLTTRPVARPPAIESGAFTDALLGKAGASVYLPAGRVALFVDPASTDGEVTVPEDDCIEPVHGLTVAIAHGAPSVVRAAQDTACLRSVIGRTKHVSYLTIGLNPLLEVDPTARQVAAARKAGVVAVDLGSDADIGGVNGIPDRWELILPKATVVADGVTVVQDGSIVPP
jgi:leucyl aminopeptidase (aminopeptidase T)